MNKSQVSPQKAKSFKASMQKLLKFCRPHLLLIIISAVLAVGASIFQLIGPNKLQDLTNIILGGIGTGIDMHAIAKIGFMLVGFYLAGFAFNYMQGYIMTVVTQKITYKMRKNISRKINLLPLKYFDSTAYGDVLSRVTNDVDTVGETMQTSVISFVHAVALFVGAIIMMFVTNWILALSAIGSTIIGFALMAVIMKSSQKHFLAMQNTLGTLNGHIEECYSGQTIIKAYNAQKTTGAKFGAINNKLASSAWKSQFYSGLMMPLMGFVGNLGYVVVCVVGSSLALSGKISFGVIVAFMIYVRQFTQPLSQFAQSATNFQSTAAASERVFEFLGESELEDEQDKKTLLLPNQVKGKVSFSHVKFGYDKDKTIIKDFSAEVQSGQKVAIVGPTGAGKTTLVNLLMRFYEIDSGDILIDGVSVKNTTRDNIHQIFGMVLQDTWLFEDTIKNNIIYNNNLATDEEVVTACKSCGIDHFIRTLPNGYNTVINENISISAGQKQLLTIARAMVQNAPMLILDEATSSVDTRTETLIQNAMDNLTKGRTSFVIAHRLSTIKNADLILVLSNGDIVEKGTHKELMAKQGYYCDLYSSQFEET